MTTEQTESPDIGEQRLLGLFDNPAIALNPWPFFATLRESSPVTKIGDMGLWLVTRYDDVVRILRAPETFSSRVSMQALKGEEIPPTILFDDPPVHTRMRGLLTKAFTPRVIEEQRAGIQEYCEQLIDAMVAGDEADIVAGLAAPLPVNVIANMLGVQDGDMATFKRWSDAIIENVGPMLMSGDDSSVAEVNGEFDAYFSERLAKLRREPEDNLLSSLVHAVGEDGSRLSEADLLLVCRVLLVAGNETTTGLLVNAMRIFSELPEVADRLRAEPGLVPSAIEEMLRYYPPFFATFRRTTKDVELSGTTIPANERLLVLLASANRDAGVFESPDEFRADREPNRHVGFGMGIHYCLGAPLARLEGEIAIETLLRKVSGVRIVDTEEDGMLRPGGPKSMTVRFEREPAKV